MPVKTCQLAAISVLLLAFSTLSVGSAAADVNVPPVPVVSDAIGGLDPTTALDTAKKTACTPQGTSNDFGTWAGMLTAQVNTDPLGPKIQYVWNTYDSSEGDTGASALAYVPDTGCAQGVQVTAQITDTSAARNCEPVVQSHEVSTYSHLHWQLDDKTNVLVGLNPDPFLLPVIYYGDDGSQDAVGNQIEEEVPPASNPQQFSPYCIRSTSTVTVKTTGSYKNNLGAFVRFACNTDEYQIRATPTGPRINYIKTVPC